MEFLDDEHLTRFTDSMKLFEVNTSDRYRIAFFYVITSNIELYTYINKVYIKPGDKKGTIEPDLINNILENISQSWGCMLRLAVKLYNEDYFKEYNFFDKFDNLDISNRRVMNQAIKIRYGID